jgi:hypothetical protein
MNIITSSIWWERNAARRTGYWVLGKVFKIYWWVKAELHNFKGFTPIPNP